MLSHIEDELLKRLPKNSYLIDVLNYVIKVGGKRFRPLLIYATASLFNIPQNKLDSLGVAIEYIHIYSLIHDDLPAMDDDDMRHGSLSCHKKFTEAEAILVGDLCQTLAFETLANDENFDDKTKILMLKTLSKFAIKMVEGQALDLKMVAQKMDLATLQTMHKLKTAALLRCAMRLGGLSDKNMSDKNLLSLDKIAKNIGLAYQIQDDVLEVTTSQKILGKSNTSDKDNDKTTYVDLLGVEKATMQYQDLYKKALGELEQFSNKEKLADIIIKMLNRSF
jgi:farnesyl diphosphate synthase/geranylgeranyl diphosphate synthase type II